MPVPSLRVPDSDIVPPLDELRAYEAVSLFVDRCTSYQPAFALTNENAADIIRICRRLDGVPLALELAAARVRVLSVAQVASRLDDRFRLLTGGSRTVLARQQTLRAMIDWSYDLLTESERLLLRRLSVFVGGWSLEAAEAVCAGESLEHAAILELLAHLIDKSLVTMLDRRGTTRYAMLETIREYAREKLVDSGEAPTLRKRHFEHFFKYGMDLPYWTGSEPAATARDGGSFQRRQIARHFGIEYENWRAAFEWIEAEPNSNDQQLLLAASMLAVTMGPGAARGRVGELRQIVTAALARSDPAAKTLPRARALLAAAMLAGMQGDPLAATLAEEAIPVLRTLGLKAELAYVLMMMVRFVPDLDSARRAMSESRALFQEAGLRWGVGQLLSIMGDTELRHGAYEAARGRYTESLALLRPLGELTLTTYPLVGLSQLACIDGDYARARALVEEVLAIRRQPDYGYPWLVASALVHLGEIDRCAGDPAHGLPFFEQALVTGREVADDVLIGYSVHNLGHVALHGGDLSTAAAHFREGLLVRWRSGPGAEIAASLAGLAGLALREGRLTEALRLFGAVDQMLGSTQNVLRLADERVRHEDLATIHSGMDDQTFDAAFREGQAATFEELEALAR